MLGKSRKSGIEFAQQKELRRWKNLDWLKKFKDDDIDFVSKEKIVIICGCGRSGSTILRVMLDTHSQVACGPESLLFLPVLINPEDLEFKFEIPQRILKEWAKKYNQWEFIIHFIREYLRRRKRKIWADKTSRNVHRFGEILTHFPNAKLLHIVRDARDVIASLRTHPKRRVVNGKIEETGIVHPFEACLERWLFAISDGFKFRDHPNYLEVRYEDLVNETESTLKKACRHISIEFEPNMLKFYQEKGGSRDPLKFPQNIEATLPIFHSSIGRWKQDLTPKEAKTVVKRVGLYLKQLGYKI